MNNYKGKKPIPWNHFSNPLVTSWTWETPHFIVTIFAEGLGVKKLYNWKISDKSKGFPVPFDSSPAESFNASVDGAVEVVAKSYPRELGYQEYAGELATTFTLSNGKKLNFGPLIGDDVILHVHDADGNETIVSGVLDVKNYDIIIHTEQSVGVVVPPERIVNIRKEFGSTNLLESMSEPVKTSRNKRIVHEEWVRGCTGKPGFNAGTTVHAPNDPYCSIHRI